MSRAARDYPPHDAAARPSSGIRTPVSEMPPPLPTKAISRSTSTPHAAAQHNEGRSPECSAAAASPCAVTPRAKRIRGGPPPRLRRASDVPRRQGCFGRRLRRTKSPLHSVLPQLLLCPPGRWQCRSRYRPPEEMEGALRYTLWFVRNGSCRESPHHFVDRRRGRHSIFCSRSDRECSFGRNIPSRRWRPMARQIIAKN